MSKSSWSVVVSVIFNVVTAVIPDNWIPPSWREPVAAIAVIALVLSLIGWGLAHWTTGRRLRSSPGAKDPMTLLLVALSGAVIAVGVWLLLPKEATNSATPQTELVVAVDQVKVGSVTPPGTVEQPFPSPIPFVALVVSLRNRGIPTIAEKYTLSFRALENQISLLGEPVAIPQQMVIDSNGDSFDAIYREDELEDKTITPIPTGGFARGRLLYFFRSVPRQSFDKRGATLTLTFVDAWGSPYVTEIRRTGVSDPDFRIFPGLRRQSIRP